MFTFAFGLCFRLGSRSPTSVRGLCFRLVPSLLFRGGLSRDFVSWLVACLRCSVCRAPSLLGLSCVPAFIDGCLRFRLLLWFSAFAFVFDPCFRCSCPPRSFIALWSRACLRFSACALLRAFVPCFGPLCLASGLCALLRAFVPCFGPFCLASGLCALLRAFVP
jgi:hypothetical protein